MDFIILHNSLCKNWSVSNSKYGHQQTIRIINRSKYAYQLNNNSTNSPNRSNNGVLNTNGIFYTYSLCADFDIFFPLKFQYYGLNWRLKKYNFPGFLGKEELRIYSKTQMLKSSSVLPNNSLSKNIRLSNS